MRYPLPGAEVKALVADPAVPGSFYLGTAHGGLYRSVDGGHSWTAPPEGAPFPGFAVTALAVDPGRPGSLWIGLTGVVRGGLLARSDDRGATFRVVRRWEDRAAARVVAVAVQKGRRVVVTGGDQGLEVSEDGGATWRPSVPPLDPGSAISFVSFHPFRPDVLYTGSFRHPFRSADLGASWRRIANGMVEDTEVFSLDFWPSDPDDIWAATCGWVYRSRDGGESWTRYREGLADRRTHVVRRDPRDPSRVLAGTTGGLFETRDAGRSFRRIGPEMVVNTLTFDPARPEVLLVGTESGGVQRSQDGGASFVEANAGLAEARVSAVAVTGSGRVVVSRAADGGHGGLFLLDPESGTVLRIPEAPSGTVVALLAAGERLLAGTPDGLFVAEAPGRPFRRQLAGSVRALKAGGGRLYAGVETEVFESRDGGVSFQQLGLLGTRVDALVWSRLPSGAGAAIAVQAGGRVRWWNGRDWGLEASAAGGGAGARRLAGGFGRPRPGVYGPPQPLGAEVDPERVRLVYRVEEGEEMVLNLPERGLSVSGWAGDPRMRTGLYLSTMGRGLFRFVPAGDAPVVVSAPERPGT